MTRKARQKNPNNIPKRSHGKGEGRVRGEKNQRKKELTTSPSLAAF